MFMTIYLDRLISFLIFIGFSFFLIVPKGGGVILAILFLSIIGLFLNRNTKKDIEKWEKLFLIGYIVYFLIVLFSNFISHGDLRDIDTASRFILVIPIYLYLRKSNVNHKSIEYGALLFCIMLGINFILPYFHVVEQFFQFSKDLGIISLYGALIGVGSLFILSKNNSLSYNFIILFGALLGISASILAGGRGSWIAAFLTTIIFFFLNPLRWSKFKKSLFFYFIIIFSLMGYLIPETGVKHRIDQGLEDILMYDENRLSETGAGQALGSVGARLEMWRSALYIFKQNPIFGVGEGNFKEKNTELINKGLINSKTIEFLHPHSEYLSTLVEQGLVGLCALLFLFLNPLIKCYKELKLEPRNPNSNVLLVFTASLILHFLFYSFTNGVFDHQNTTLFFAAYVVIGMGLFSSIKDKF